uniref:SF3 helicase domain-containing protein n=1 Tax=Picornavirales sp. TaxID=1955153 RepID=A0A6M3YNQ3_9VIRU|nr:MAG: hypothetical protein 1 [Picornavirales sp.]
MSFASNGSSLKSEKSHSTSFCDIVEIINEWNQKVMGSVKPLNLIDQICRIFYAPSFKDALPPIMRIAELYGLFWQSMSTTLAEITKKLIYFGIKMFCRDIVTMADSDTPPMPPSMDGATAHGFTVVDADHMSTIKDFFVSLSMPEIASRVAFLGPIIATLVCIAVVIVLYLFGTGAARRIDDNFIKNITEMGMTARSLLAGEQLFSKAWAFLNETVLSVLGVAWVPAPDSAAKKFISDARILLTDVKKCMDEIHRDPGCVFRTKHKIRQIKDSIHQLEDLHHALALQTKNMGNAREVMMDIRQTYEKMTSLVEKILKAATKKQIPALLYVSGDSGVGKTHALTRLTEMLAELHERKLLTTCVRNPGDSFQSNYNGQNIYLMPDFGQDLKDEDHVELQKIHSDEAYALNMAAIEDKGMNFCSQYCLIASNIDYVNTSATLNMPQILDRRRDVFVKATSPNLAQWRRDHPGLMTPPDGDPFWTKDCEHIVFTTMPMDRNVSAQNFPSQTMTLRQIAIELFCIQERRRVAFEEYMKVFTAVFDEEFLGEKHGFLDESDATIPTITGLIGDAGTGKTWTLEHEYLPWLIGKGYNTKVIRGAEEYIDLYQIESPTVLFMSDVTSSTEKLKAFRDFVFEAGDGIVRNVQAIFFSANDCAFYDGLTQDLIDALNRRIKVFTYKFKRRNIIGARYTAADVREHPENRDHMMNIVCFKGRILPTNMLDQLKNLHTPKKIKGNSMIELPKIGELQFDHDVTVNVSEEVFMAYLMSIPPTAGVLEVAKKLVSMVTMSWRSKIAIGSLLATIATRLLGLALDDGVTTLRHYMIMVNKARIKSPMRNTLVRVTLGEQHYYVGASDDGYVVVLDEYSDGYVRETGSIVGDEVYSIAEKEYMKGISNIIKKQTKGTRILDDSPDNNVRSVASVLVQHYVPDWLITLGHCASFLMQYSGLGLSAYASYNNAKDIKTYADMKPVLEQSPTTVDSKDRGPKARPMPKTKNMKATSAWVNRQSLGKGKKESLPSQNGAIVQSYKEQIGKDFDPNLVFQTLETSKEKLAETMDIKEVQQKFPMLSTLTVDVEIGPQLEAMSDPAAWDLMQLVSNNMILLFDSKKQFVNYAVMVYKNVGMTVLHSISHVKYAICPVLNSYKEFTLEVIGEDAYKDLAIFELAPYVEFRSIIKHLPCRSSATSIIKKRALFVTRSRGSTDKTVIVRNAQISEYMCIDSENVLDNGYQYAGVVEGFTTEMEVGSTYGDCGAPIIINNVQVPQKLVAIHKGGYKNRGIGIDVYQDDFAQFLPRQESATLQPLRYQRVNLEESIDCGVNSRVIGTIDHLNYTPPKTSLYRSPFATDMCGDNFEPSVLSVTDKRMKEPVDVATEGFMKWDRLPPKYDEALWKETVYECREYIMSEIATLNIELRVGTLTEALNYMSDFDHSKSLNRKASPGHPWDLFTGHKSSFLQFDEKHKIWKFKNTKEAHEIKDSVARLIDACRRGQQTVIVHKAALKDELKQKEKIYDKPKTRGFVCTPFEYLLACRMYFHAAMAAETACHNTCVFKEGLNVHSQEYDNMVKDALSYSRDWSGGDGKEFDASMWRDNNAETIEDFNEAYRRFDPNWKPEDDTIRTNLGNCVLDPIIVLPQNQQLKNEDNIDTGLVLLQFFTGNISGNNFTLKFNGHGQLRCTVYSWKKLATAQGELQMRCITQFLHFVWLAIMGDDMLMSVRSEVREWFNLVTLAEVYKSDFDITITNEDKMSPLYKWKPFDQVEFLKRLPVRCGSQWRGALQDPTFDKMFNWTRSPHKHYFTATPHHVFAELENMENQALVILDEAMYRGLEFFSKVRKHLDGVLKDHGSNLFLPFYTGKMFAQGL